MVCRLNEVCLQICGADSVADLRRNGRRNGRHGAGNAALLVPVTADIPHGRGRRRLVPPGGHTAAGSGPTAARIAAARRPFGANGQLAGGGCPLLSASHVHRGGGHQRRPDRGQPERLGGRCLDLHDGAARCRAAIGDCRCGRADDRRRLGLASVASAPAFAPAPSQPGHPCKPATAPQDPAKHGCFPANCRSVRKGVRPAGPARTGRGDCRGRRTRAAFVSVRLAAGGCFACGTPIRPPCQRYCAGRKPLPRSCHAAGQPSGRACRRDDHRPASAGLNAHPGKCQWPGPHCRFMARVPGAECAACHAIHGGGQVVHRARHAERRGQHGRRRAVGPASDPGPYRLRSTALHGRGGPRHSDPAPPAKCHALIRHAQTIQQGHAA